MRSLACFAPSRHSYSLSTRGAPGAKAPGAVPSLRERGLFDDLSDFLRMDDERGMAAGDFRRLRLHPGCEQLLGLGRDAPCPWC